MRRILLIISALLLAASFFRAQEFDSAASPLPQEDSLASRYAPLDSLLTDFYSALLFEDNSAKCAEMDALISSSSLKDTREYVARKVFDHYRHSRVMGEEAVAIHVYDKWFAGGELSLDGEFAAMEAEIFVNFNRHSLIGMSAPVVSLFKPCGGRQSVPRSGALSVLFFYDTSCSKCMMEAAVLPQIFEGLDLKMDFVAVYTGSEKRDWKAFRKNFRLPSKSVRLIHLWDPEMKSDYQRLYGVTGTPRMFVVLANSEIVGRRLEVENLKQILNYIVILNEKEKEK